MRRSVVRWSRCVGPSDDGHPYGPPGIACTHRFGPFVGYRGRIDTAAPDSAVAALWLDFHETSDAAPGAMTVDAVLDLHSTPRLDGSSNRPRATPVVLDR